MESKRNAKFQLSITPGIYPVITSTAAGAPLLRAATDTQVGEAGW
jgi:hypothetical protein